MILMHQRMHRPSLPPRRRATIARHTTEPCLDLRVGGLQDGTRLLRLNDPRRGFHSVRPGGGLLTGAYYDVLYLGPLLARGGDVLVLGMGGGTTVRAYLRLYPGAHVTAVEIDPVIVRIAREYMGIEEGPGLTVQVDDARPFLARRSTTFDVIEVDLFAGGPCAPFYCLTGEFFAAARKRLNPSGLVSLNVYAPGGDRTLARAVAATMGTSPRARPTSAAAPSPR